MAIYNHTWFDFISDQGTKYRVKINSTALPNTSDGLGRETLGGPDGFRLEYDGESQETFKPVIGSKVSFTINYGTVQMNAGLVGINTETAVIESIIASLRVLTTDAQYTVEIRRDPDDTDTLFWCGVLLTEQIEVANEAYPRAVKFTASDAIANLDYVDYDEYFGIYL